jgi:hypothetical protein
VVCGDGAGTAVRQMAGGSGWRHRGGGAMHGNREGGGGGRRVAVRLRVLLRAGAAPRRFCGLSDALWRGGVGGGEGGGVGVTDVTCGVVERPGSTSRPPSSLPGADPALGYRVGGGGGGGRPRGPRGGRGAGGGGGGRRGQPAGRRECSVAGGGGCVRRMGSVTYVRCGLGRTGCMCCEATRRSQQAPAVAARPAGLARVRLQVARYAHSTSRNSCGIRATRPAGALLATLVAP